MLAHCTTDPPLPSLAVNLATDAFSSLSNIAQAAVPYDFKGAASSDDSSQSHPGPFSVLEEQLGLEVVANMVDFWVTEWVIE
ncbi:hypothetical protein KCU89_g8415, partial [Aureobasidium melanogenum]